MELPEMALPHVPARSFDSRQVQVPELSSAP